MKISIQVVIEHEDESELTIVEEVGCLRREELQLGTLGLQLTESKHLLSAIQQVLVREQAAAYIYKGSGNLPPLWLPPFDQR